MPGASMEARAALRSGKNLVAARLLMAAGAKPIASTRLAEIAEAWRPWRAYAAMALWMSQTR